MRVPGAQHTVCFDSNRKPNPWWQNSQWSPPSFPVTPSLRLPAGCWTEHLRTRKSRFRCRFQPQLSSLTSLCRWHPGQRRFLGRRVKGSLRCCEDHSLWPWEFINSQSSGQFVGKKVDSLPHFLSLLPSISPSPPFSFLLPLLLSHYSLLSSLLSSPHLHFLFLSLQQTGTHPGPGALQGDWSTSMKKDNVALSQKFHWGETVNKQTDE